MRVFFRHVDVPVDEYNHSLSFSQVKKSTLNPNAKEFNPNKTQMPMVRKFIHIISSNCLLEENVEILLIKNTVVETINCD